MRQGPDILKYAIIGDGRLAKHLKEYLRLSGSHYFQWSRQDQFKVELELILKQSSIVLLAISDSVITEFAKDLVEQYQFTDKIIHFSASTETTYAQCLHPLFSFSHNLETYEVYNSIPFCETTGHEGLFQEIFPHLNNPTFQLSLKQRRLYHALLVSSGNFTSLLWKTVEEQFKNKLDLDKNLLKPYQKVIFKNVLSNASQAATGPLVRGDVETVRENLQALDDSPLEKIYLSFVNQYFKGESPA